MVGNALDLCPRGGESFGALEGPVEHGLGLGARPGSPLCQSGQGRDAVLELAERAEVGPDVHVPVDLEPGFITWWDFAAAQSCAGPNSSIRQE